MGRQAREYSSTGFYHVVFRGINHQHIFEGPGDYEYMLEIVRQLKAEMAFEVHAYCLLGNHGHLLLREQTSGQISLIMKRLLTRYAMYFNRRYERSGALIANRYKSTPVAIDEYFILLQRYIHQNALTAGLVARPEDYAYSSYSDYLGGGGLTDTAFSLALLGREEWFRLHRMAAAESFYVSGQVGLSEDEVRRRIMQLTKGIPPQTIGHWPKSERDAMLGQLKAAGLSIRQIERVTGISRGVVARACSVEVDGVS